MNNLLVSAIITTYGRKFDDIKKSIHSVINQDYKNIEIILVDDNGNNENRIDIENNISSFSNVKYIKHDVNKGAQSARNTGIENSSGELIAFLDDDDEWSYNKISEQVKLYDNDVGLVYCKGYLIDENTNIHDEYITSKKFMKVVTFHDLLYADRIGTTTQALISRKAIEVVGNFDLNQPARQDYEMWLRISKKFRCVGCDKFLFNHYIHKGEQISKNINKSILGLKRIYIKYYDDYKKYPLARQHYYYMQFFNYKKSRKIGMLLLTFIKMLLYFPIVVVINGRELFNKIKNRKG